ncbi:unnamed protein product [Amoebophrya sp. A25]|nr:unnamed protein product [Amoebophrya sp. A25]|eukprot:GSA25T00024108001.1
MAVIEDHLASELGCLSGLGSAVPQRESLFAQRRHSNEYQRSKLQRFSNMSLDDHHSGGTSSMPDCGMGYQASTSSTAGMNRRTGNRSVFQRSARELFARMDEDSPTGAGDADAHMEDVQHEMNRSSGSTSYRTTARNERELHHGPKEGDSADSGPMLVDEHQGSENSGGGWTNGGGLLPALSPRGLFGSLFGGGATGVGEAGAGGAGATRPSLPPGTTISVQFGARPGEYAASPHFLQHHMINDHQQASASTNPNYHSNQQQFRHEQWNHKNSLQFANGRRQLAMQHQYPRTPNGQDQQLHDHNQNQQQFLDAQNYNLQHNSSCSSSSLLRELPALLTTYARAAFNIGIVSLGLYFVYAFYSTIRDDIHTKVVRYSQEVLDQIDKCSHDYAVNMCGIDVRPALEGPCRTWKVCMEQDAMQVAYRAKFSGATFGEALNGFFQELEWKTIVGFPLLLLTVVSLLNVLLYLGQGPTSTTGKMLGKMSSSSTTSSWEPPQHSTSVGGGFGSTRGATHYQTSFQALQDGRGGAAHEDEVGHEEQELALTSGERGIRNRRPQFY